jgi:hypothetical protein
VLCFGQDDPKFGESAFITIEHRGQDWAYVTLEGIDESALGDARTADARVFVMLVDENDERDDWENPIKRDFADALARATETGLFVRSARKALEDARELLLENARGRVPIDDPEGLTVFGSAMSQLSASDSLWQELESDTKPPG